MIGWPHVWTVDDLRDAPCRGWFYGLFRDAEGRLRFGELYPAWGSYCATWPQSIYSPRAWWWALKDTLCLRPRPLAK